MKDVSKFGQGGMSLVEGREASFVKTFISSFIVIAFAFYVIHIMCTQRKKKKRTPKLSELKSFLHIVIGSKKVVTINLL